MKYWVLKVLKRLLFFGFLPIVLSGLLLLSRSSIILEEKILSANEAQQAQNIARDVVAQFTSQSNVVQIELTQAQINALSVTASYSIPSLKLDTRLSSYSMLIAGSKEISLFGETFFLNLYCMFAPGLDRFEITECYLGRIPLPGWFIRWSIEFTTGMVFGNDVKITALKILDNAKLKNDKLILTTTKVADFKEQINTSLKDAAEVVRKLQSFDDVDEENVQVYIAKLKSINSTESSLAFYIGELFTLAKARSVSEDPVKENTAALWALAIEYGSPKFARFIGLTPDYSETGKGGLTLRGRGDLKLHFLYSIVLQQLGRESIGLKIGEFKEILDSGKGGSGFSFADLAADKSGLALAELLSRDKEAAIRGQNILAGSNDESLFFPFIQDLPEGFREDEFQAIFTNTESVNFKNFEQKLDDRIAQLPLHNVNLTSFKKNEFSSGSHTLQNGKWLTIDTHIHSKYSDGNQEVITIAKNAFKFGCDAIAITDHGDYNLKKVVTNEYFDSIEQANALFPDLTVIAGLEWNIPPFMGREHATLLLPQHVNTRRDLTVFRQRFDSWGRKSEQLLSMEDSLLWLQKNASPQGLTPLIIYNHPSRKDAQSGENKHDLVEWRKYNNLVIGMSGAPGHQKDRGVNNGSYNYKLKTINGWDPAVAVIGGEWDQLLQAGHIMTAARAPSDFHGPEGDFWPCEFSTTHTYAASNLQNDILSSLRTGKTWAQHGKFVENLNFTVSSEQSHQVAEMGQVTNIGSGDAVKIELNLDLNTLDWQGYATSLDEVEMVVISSSSIKSIRFEPRELSTNQYKFNYNYVLGNSDVVFRWRGKSIQPEKNNFMFYTNPIYVRAKD